MELDASNRTIKLSTFEVYMFLLNVFVSNVGIILFDAHPNKKRKAKITTKLLVKNFMSFSPFGLLRFKRCLQDTFYT